MMIRIINFKLINLKSIGQILFVFSLLTLVILTTRSVYSNLDSSWTSIRLAPSFALIKGLPLYSTADSSPWVMIGYGPLYPFMYLPSTLGGTPKAAVGIATVLAYLYLLIPVLLISRSFCDSFKGKLKNPIIGPWSITLLFALIASLVPSLHYVLASVHVDSPALGLLLFATYFTILACRSGDRQNLVYTCLSGMFVGMSISCKLNVLPSIAVFGFAVWWVLGIRRAIALFAFAMLSIMVSYSWVIWTSGAKSVLLNFEVLGNFPWTRFHLADHHLGNSSELTTLTTEKIATAIITLRDYAMSYGVTLLATVIIFLTCGRKFHDMRLTPDIGIFAFLIALSVVLLPSSVASFTKYGGDINSRALVSLPLTLAAIYGVLLAQTKGNSFLHWFILFAWGGVLLVTALPPLTWALRKKTDELSGLEEAYCAIKDSPGVFYFPYEPLAHVLAGDEFRPNIDAVYSYAIGKRPVDKIAFQKSMPLDLKYIAISPQFSFWGLSEINRLMPDFVGDETLPNIKKHQVLVRLRQR